MCSGWKVDGSSLDGREGNNSRNIHAFTTTLDCTDPPIQPLYERNPQMHRDAMSVLELLSAIRRQPWEAGFLYFLQAPSGAKERISHNAKTYYVAPYGAQRVQFPAPRGLRRGPDYAAPDGAGKQRPCSNSHGCAVGQNMTPLAGLEKSPLARRRVAWASVV